MDAENDGQLLDRLGADAAKWAHEFCQIVLKNSNKYVVLDEGWMIAWFANAIEAGARREHAKTNSRLQ